MKNFNLTKWLETFEFNKKIALKNTLTNTSITIDPNDLSLVQSDNFTLIGKTNPTLANKLLKKYIYLPKVSQEEQKKYLRELVPFKWKNKQFLKGCPLSFANIEKVEEDSLIVMGVPFALIDKTKLTQYAPEVVRQSSHNLNFRGDSYLDYQMLNGRKELRKIYDLGDIDIDHFRKEDFTKILSKIYQKIPHKSLPLCIGGDHSILAGIIDGILCNHKKVGIIYFDQHLDLEMRHSKKVTIQELNHSNVISYILDKYPHQVKVCNIGASNFLSTFKEYNKKLRYNNYIHYNISEIITKNRGDLYNSIKEFMGDLPVYLSIDCDVIDRSNLSLTGYPNPFGMSHHQLYSIVKDILTYFKIIGIDLVEFAPNPDEDISYFEGKMLIHLLEQFFIK